MAKYVKKICCTCIHCKREKDGTGRIECKCEITGKYLGYLTVMGDRCDKWVVDPFQLGKVRR